MRPFRRRRPLHERLLDQAGLEEQLRPEGPPVVGSIREPGIHGLAREREWDAVATVEAPEIKGHEVSFDVLPDRTVLVEAEDGDAALAPLADAVERDLQPPYRARAVRQATDLWAVAARKIEVVRLQPRGGNRIELASRGAERTLTVDGAQEFGTIPELEALGSPRYRDYVVRAERLDDEWWEVVIDPL